MSGTRAFKNLAALRDRFVENTTEEDEVLATPVSLVSSKSVLLDAMQHPEQPSPLQKTLSVVPSTSGKVDGRRQRKVLKTPSVSLSVAVRQEIHEDVSAMLFARKSTWIALLDELLLNYVQQAKSSGKFPK